MAHTDNDSWDLASSVGTTATMVALGRALSSREPDALIDTITAVSRTELFTRHGLALPPTGEGDALGEIVHVSATTPG